MHAVDPLHNNEDNITLTAYCEDCIYHEYFKTGSNDETHEHCVIWGRDGCYSGCDRKRTEPEHRWTDANRWDRD